MRPGDKTGSRMTGARGALVAVPLAAAPLTAQSAAAPTAPRPPSGAAGGVDVVWQTLERMWVDLLARLPYLVIGFVVFLLFYLAGRLVRRAAHAAGQRTRLDVRLADLFGTLAVALLTILGVLVAAVVVFPTFRPGDLVAGLGITSVAVGFAFKDILQNFFAGILILLRKPFVVGDQIRVRDFEGTVEEITTRSTRLKTYDGERVVIPNGDVYTSAITVRTAYKSRRVKLVVGVGYGDALEEARATITRAVAAADGVLTDPGPWVYVEELAPSAVNFAVYFWTASHQANVLRTRDRVATAIKLALDAAGIEMPYPHSVVLFHDETHREHDGGRPAPPASNGQPERPGARASR